MDVTGNRPVRGYSVLNGRDTGRTAVMFKLNPSDNFLQFLRETSGTPRSKSRSTNAVTYSLSAYAGDRLPCAVCRALVRSMDSTA